MWVDSEGIPGKGSTFHFTIEAEEAEAPVRAYLQAIQADLKGKRVLVVDDNATSRRILTLQTQAWGMEPRATGSPKEALAWIRGGEPFDVAVVDRQMPDMDGLMLAAEIRKLQEASALPGAPLPLVMISSLGRGEAGVGEGQVAAFLLKPIRASQLYDALVSILATEEEPGRREERPARPEFDAEMGERLPLRILLAEDHVTNQKLALLMLRRLGYRADVAANGLEVLDALERQPYDVILMDVQMPEMDGLEATREVRRRWPAEQGPRIVAITANVMQEDRRACLAAGMDDYLGKPIRVAELVAALSECRPGSEPAAQEPAAAASAVPAMPVASSDPAADVAPEEGVPSAATLDQAALANLRELVGDEPALLAELIDCFLEETPSLLVQLRQSLEAGDTAGLHRAAHTLKSTSRDFGADQLAEWAMELEAMGRAGSLAGAADLVARVEVEYPRVKVALEQVRKG
jgi:CheY-like chemotaxis protein